MPTVAAFSTSDERIIGATFYDRTRGEFGSFGYVMLGRDAYGRFQVFESNGPYVTSRAANKAIERRLTELEDMEAPEIPMRDDSKPGVDLFTSIKGVTNLNPKFINLKDGRNPSAARELLTEISKWFVDLDGNFVKDFQTTGFDGRIWELYLFATFKEMDFRFDNSSAVPDFCLSRGDKKVFIEATTAGPSGNIQHAIEGPPPAPPDNLLEYNEKEMAIKFGSPLETKVKKAYWDLPNVKGHPFVIAIADFHAPASMIWSQGALQNYLYGFGAEKCEVDGQVRWRSRKLTEHAVGSKIVPSDFFAQKRHEHISAILFSNAGTLTKFNRMGVLAGFGDDAVQLVRSGGLFTPGPDAYEPEPFVVNIEDPDYFEDWVDEVEVFHNPNAINPLDDDMFPGVANYRLVDGEVQWTSPRRPVIFSYTRSLAFSFSGPEGFERRDKPTAPAAEENS